MVFDTSILENTRLFPSTRYHTVRVQGLNIFYREAGPANAPTILLLHGFPSSSHMFRELLIRLGDRFHLLAPDYPGFGYSDMPSPQEFTYSFDRLTDIVEEFVKTIGLTHYALYMQDYGGPVGLRLAVRHPECVTGLIIQNANIYREGIQPAFENLLRPLWENRSPETEAPVLKIFEREGTVWQYETGTQDKTRLNPDAWTMDQLGMDRPSSWAIQLEIQANYHTNLEQYPQWQAFLKTYQPPVLVTWGKHDPFFGMANIDFLQHDLDDVEVHILDAGHFALEDHGAEIAYHIRRFLNRTAASGNRL